MVTRRWRMVAVLAIIVACGVVGYATEAPPSPAMGAAVGVAVGAGFVAFVFLLVTIN